jgi:hypothetical protein
MIDDRRHAVIRRDRQEFRLELVALADIDEAHFVRKPALLEHDGDLPAIRRRPVIEIDRLHLSPSLRVRHVVRHFPLPAAASA